MLVGTVNYISCTFRVLQELVGLSALSQLHTLSLCDPTYPPNPVCRLCNYSTHTLYHLPHLQWLDDREVKGHQLQQVVQGLVSSKKLYYRMREHQARMACLQECKTLCDKQLSICEPTLSCIRTLTQHIKSVSKDNVFEYMCCFIPSPLSLFCSISVLT